MIYARINVNVDTGVYLFLHISCGTEYSQHSNALAHPNPSANSNKFKLLPYHCYAKDSVAFLQNGGNLCNLNQALAPQGFQLDGLITPTL